MHPATVSLGRLNPTHGLRGDGHRLLLTHLAIKVFVPLLSAFKPLTALSKPGTTCHIATTCITLSLSRANGEAQRLATSRSSQSKSHSAFGAVKDRAILRTLPDALCKAPPGYPRT